MALNQELSRNLPAAPARTPTTSGAHSRQAAERASRQAVLPALRAARHSACHTVRHNVPHQRRCNVQPQPLGTTVQAQQHGAQPRAVGGRQARHQQRGFVRRAL